MTEPESQQKIKLNIHCASCGEPECVCPEPEDKPAEVTESNLNFRAGQYIGGIYKVIELIGEGGMGFVYKVHHEALNKYYAAKVLKPELIDNDKIIARFDSEAKALGQIGNPHIIGISNYGISEAGAPYLVMDFIEGCSLEDEIKSKGFIEEARALKIFAQVCDGLSVAHINGVIHRDLKPSNIMITRDRAGEEKVVIVDFGIAKRQAAETKLTQTGDIFGTPLYMSPEQCMGNPIDARSDLYSLGCVMYEALSGVSPFSADNPIRTIFKHVNDDAEELGKRCVVQKVSPGTVQMIHCCLEKSPANRPPDAATLREDILRVQKGERPLNKRRFALSTRGRMYAKLFLLPILVMVPTFFIAKALYPTGEYTEVMGKRDAAIFSMDYKNAEEYSNKLLKITDRLGPNFSHEWINARIAAAYDQTQFGRVDLAIKYYSEAADLASKRGDWSLAINCWIPQAHLLLQSKEFEKAASVSAKIVAECESHDDPNPLHKVQALLMLSKSQDSMKNYEQADSAAMKALTIVESDQQLRKSYTAFLTYEHIGSVRLNHGDLKGAETYLQKADQLIDPSWSADRIGNHSKRLEEVKQRLNKAVN